MDSKKIQTSKNCVTSNSLGTYASKGLYPTLRFLSTLLILTLTTAVAWAANSDATTLSTGNDDVPAVHEDATVTDWATLKLSVEAGGTVTLMNDVTRNADEDIVVTKAVTLDLNGHTIYGYETGSSTHYQYTPIFSVGTGGKLTITDGSSDKRGTITNVWGTSAISIEGRDESSYGEATFEAGTIASGGVSIKNYGRFTMTGGTISIGGNQGVDVGNNATFTMTGGTITGNSIGVHIYSASSTFTVSGNVNITDNTERDVSLYYDDMYPNDRFNPIHIGGALASTARIGVYTNRNQNNLGYNQILVFTDGLKGRGMRENFVRNNVGEESLYMANLESGEMALSIPYTLTVPDNVTVNELTPTSEDQNKYMVGYGDHITLNYGGAVSEGYSVVYIATAGTVSGNFFTMPNEDVTISTTTVKTTLELTAYQATLNGISKYWTTFYHPMASYQLSDGAQAFYMKSDKALYIVGDGDVVPKGKAVVIMANAASIELTKVTDPSITVIGNILVGTSAEKTVEAGTVYVMNKDASNNVGFYQYSGTTIPANKAYVEQ